MSNVVKQYEIWTANLEPAIGSEPGKVRPIVILQSDILHLAKHTSTIVCSISSQHKEGFSLIRLPVPPSTINGLKKQSYILCDQIRAIDMTRLQERIGRLDEETIERLLVSIKAILTL
ncbi:type II toxin-antitoxin system PemK/MazF family toxin [Mucilaginibacter puniceus]